MSDNYVMIDSKCEPVVANHQGFKQVAHNYSDNLHIDIQTQTMRRVRNQSTETIV